MSNYLRQSTASQGRMTPCFIDDTDFKTPKTGLTIANTDVKLCVNGGASANKNSGGGTHRVNGCYSLTFDATDTATVGEFDVSIVVAGALPVFMKFWVLEEAVFDALFAAAAPGYLQPATAGRTLAVSAAGVADSNAVQVRGTAVNTGAAAGYFPADANLIAVNGDSSLALALENLLAGYENTGSLGGPPGFNPFRSASALAGASGSVTLDSGASAVTDFYAGAIVVLHAGTGAGQARLITAYNGTTKVATVTPNWATPPDNTTVYAVVPRGPADVRAMTIAGNASVGGNFSIGGALTMNAFGCATTFTVTGAFVAASASNDVRVNVKKINDATLLGVGTVGNEWRPA